MVADFYLATNEMNRDERTFLSLLKDPRKQCATLSLYSDGFFAWECRLDQRWYRLRHLWNRIGYWLDRRFVRDVKIEGRPEPLRKLVWTTPKFILPSVSLEFFLRAVQKRSSSAAERNGAVPVHTPSVDNPILPIPPPEALDR
jgi:hypothetical protein